jgi:hypothetical protein
MRKRNRCPMPRRGSVLLNVMMFVIMVGAMASVIRSYSVGNVVLGAAEGDSTRALVAAESGMSYLLLQTRMAPMPIITEGAIGNMGDHDLLWAGTNIQGRTGNNGIAVQLAGAINQCASFVNSTSTVAIPAGSLPLVTPAIAVDPATGDCSNFTLTVEWDGTYIHPTSQTIPSHVLLRLTSVGTSGHVSRRVTMDVAIQKTLRYGMYSNIAIQLGKNTVVTGDIVSKLTTFTKGPPVWMLSDFTRLTDQSLLDTKLEQFRDLLVGNDPSYSNRLSVATDPALKALAQSQGFDDVNGDGYIDDYDVFLGQLDPSETGRITQSQFTASNGKPMDAQLFVLLDTLNTPVKPGAERPGLTPNPTPNMGSLLNQWLGIPDNSWGYDGDGQLDKNDCYAKVLGTIKVRVSAQAWETWANDTSPSGGARFELGYREQLQGPIISPDPTKPPVQFNYVGPDTQDLTPQSFDTSSYKAKAGTGGAVSGRILAGTATAPTTVSDKIIAYANATEIATVDEISPIGAANPQSKYRRPVFKNVKFVNCKIAKGTNALFQNCTFEGVTYVDLETRVTTTGNHNTTDAITDDPGMGMTWAKKMKSGSFSPSTALTSTNSYGFCDGNNLRFDACKINGPLASAVPSAYTHLANNWEFDGATVFNNTSDPTATILAPNTNVDCGSFLAPPTGPLPTSSLTGVVVAGNVNMRGGAWNVDGSIITLGKNASGGPMNTTLGYFGPDDAATDPHAIPLGGFGRIALRYNPIHAMPAGILVPLTVIRMPQTYQIH